MGNILEEFWYGNIEPMEQSTGKSREIKELLKLKCRNRDRLQDSMTAEQQETFGKYEDCINEMHSIMELEIFSYDLGSVGDLCWQCCWITVKKHKENDHTADYQSLLCGLSRLLAPLEDVTQKLSFIIIPK